MMQQPDQVLRRGPRRPPHRDHIVSWPNERMRRLVELLRHARVDLAPLFTHRFPLDRTGLLKVAVTP